MNILIAGGTGFIGRSLTNKLIESGNEITILTRNKEKAYEIFNNNNKKIIIADWTDIKHNPLNISFGEFDCIINLSGESLATGRWNRKTKDRIMSSRIKSTKKIVNSIKQKVLSTKVLINASAVGYYGPHGEEELSENAGNGDDFLSKVCRRWETAAMEAEHYGVRVVMIRTGVVLGSEGALQRMSVPFRFYAGGTIGSGKQYMSWIHIEDLIRIYIHTAKNADISGPVNATAPLPVTNAEFAKTLAKVMSRPAFLKVPAFVMRLLYREMADIVLTGQRVLPVRLQQSGFSYTFPDLEAALKDILIKARL